MGREAGNKRTPSHLSHEGVPVLKAPAHDFSVIVAGDIEKFPCCALYILM